MIVLELVDGDGGEVAGRTGDSARGHRRLRNRLAFKELLNRPHDFVSGFEVLHSPRRKPQDFLEIRDVEWIRETKSLLGLGRLLKQEHDKIALLTPGHRHGFFAREVIPALG